MRPEKIREMRRALGWTQEELADRAGVSQPIVSTIEKGGRIADKSRDKIVAALTSAQVPVPPKVRVTQIVAPVSPPNVPPAAGDSPGMGTLSTNTADVLELALTRAIDQERHLIRDANAVLAAYGDTPLPQVSEVELKALASRWLDAAAELRREGAMVDAQALSARVSLRALRSH